MTATQATAFHGLTQQEAADRVGVSLHTIQRAVAAGHLRAKNAGNGKRRLPRIKLAELERWFDSLEDA